MVTYLKSHVVMPHVILERHLLLLRKLSPASELFSFRCRHRKWNQQYRNDNHDDQRGMKTVKMGSKFEGNAQKVRNNVVDDDIPRNSSAESLPAWICWNISC
ncbi:hypothetical protein NE237_013574 [Protea cynaroides]|uniref:Uncharacterized protein n=1 Tax=Protea cynaroides TaxID=273540 RepID=A0A9Q0JYP4_9MAGN|nr:hypothetical protein NE237_013574 [Protea cynaroides]